MRPRTVLIKNARIIPRVFPHPSLGLEDTFYGHLLLRGSVIEKVGPGEFQGWGRGNTMEVSHVYDAQGAYASAGWSDGQINGAVGVSVNDADADGIIEIAKACGRWGLTGILPTVITDSPDRMLRALDAIMQASADPMWGKMILGAHVEGPDFGVHGAHNPKWIRKGNNEFEVWKRLVLSNPDAVLLHTGDFTSPEFIQLMRDNAGEKRVIFATSHTDPITDQSNPKNHLGLYEEAKAAGLRRVIHLGNAYKPLVNKYDLEYIGLILDDSEMLATIIADGVHLHPRVIKIFVRSKLPQNIVLWTDMMAGAGMQCPVTVKIGDAEITIGSDGIARLNSQNLAGSTLTPPVQFQNVLNWVPELSLALASVIAMGTVNSARFLGLEKSLGTLSHGNRANVTVFTHDTKTHAITVKATIVDGKFLYPEELR